MLQKGNLKAKHALFSLFKILIIILKKDKKIQIYIMEELQKELNMI